MEDLQNHFESTIFSEIDAMIRIYIADDHQVLLDGLTTLLSSFEDLKVVGYGHNGRDAIEFLKSNEVDVMLLDINMPEMNGIDACKIIGRDHPEVKVIALSMYNKASFIQQMLKSGAKGYVLKNTGQEELVEAIRQVHSGEQYLGESVSKTLMTTMLGRMKKNQSYIPELTRREKEILDLIAKEYTTQEISNELHISLNTVETHRKNLLSKCGVRNSVGLIKIAYERGLLD